MKSIGITILQLAAPSHDKKDGDDGIQLHLNVWKFLPKRPWNNYANIPYYLDIGIMTKFSTSGIKIYLPFEVNEGNSWIDLGKVLAEHPNLLCTLFNDDYEKNTKISNFTIVELNKIKIHSSTPNEISTEFGGCIYLRKLLEEIRSKKYPLKKDLRPKGDTPEKFAIYSLQKEDVSIEKFKEREDSGVILKISIPCLSEFNKDQYYYFRLRIGIKKDEGLAYKTGLSNDWLQSAFTNLDMYNLQINQQRDISQNIKFNLSSDHYEYAKFSKIHIMYIANPKVTVENGSSTKSDSRIIELDKWNHYLPEYFEVETYVAHHWKPKIRKGETLNNTSLFFTAKYPEFKKRRIISYASVVIILGCLGSLMATLICCINPIMLRKISVVLVTSILFYVVCYRASLWISHFCGI